MGAEGQGIRMMPWSTIGMVVIAGLMLAGTYAKGRLDGARGPNAKIAAMAAQYAAEDAARAAQVKQREDEDGRADARIRAAQAAAAVAVGIAEARAAAATDEAAALAARLRAQGAGGVLPGDARRVFDRAAGSGGGSPASIRASPAGAAAVAGIAPGADGSPPDGVAARPPDAAPVECVTVFEVGARNSAKALYNAAGWLSCQREHVALWEACTGQQYPTRELAPWLISQP